ncbi:MAG: DNA cytosine methyltransferase [Alphaproteobacteria bacterium]
MRSLELFTGLGGLAKGLCLSGFEHRKFVEFNQHACNSLRSNFDSDLVFEGDIRDFNLNTINEIDLLAGGPPCQPFSIGGNHRANDDSRDMFPFATNAVKTLRPKIFVFENVKGLGRDSFSQYLEYILLSLSLPDCSKKPEQDWRDHLVALKKTPASGLHYDVSFKLLNAANYGIPQIRERIFIVGIRSDLNVTWTFPKETHSKRRLIFEQKKSGDYWARHNVRPDEKHLEKYGDVAGWGQDSLFSEPRKPWLTVRDALSHLPDPTGGHNIQDHLFKDGAKSYPGHTGSYYDLPAKTLKAGVHGVPGGENMVRYADGEIRYFTVHEAKLLQTFPSDFVVTGAWTEAMRQIGNAVPVNLANIIGNQIRNFLKSAGVDARLDTNAA